MGEFDLSLIVEFRSRPCLYDRNSPQFKDKLYTAQQWQEISNKLGYDVSILKDRMLQLRNRYNLEKRRIEQLREKSPHKIITSPWLMYENLQFLSDHIKARRRYKNMLPLGRHKEEQHFRLRHDSVNDYTLGTDDAALEAAQEEANRFMSIQNHHLPFPNDLLAVKVEENMSDQASEAETIISRFRDRSHNNESEINPFGDTSNLTSEIHSPSKMRQDLNKYNSDKQQQQEQMQQQMQHQQRLQQVHQQHALRQQQPQQPPHLQATPHPQHPLKSQFAHLKHSTPNSNGSMIRNSSGGGGGGNDPENLLFAQRHGSKTKPKSLSNDNYHHDNDSQQDDPKRGPSMPAMANYLKKTTQINRLNARDNKYNAFGNFVSSSLMDLPQKMALELVEKFTMDTVKALKMKMSETDETPNASTDLRDDK